MNKKQLKEMQARITRDTLDWSAYFTAALDKLESQPASYQVFYNTVSLDHYIQDLDKPWSDQNRLENYQRQAIALDLYNQKFYGKEALQ